MMAKPTRLALVSATAESCVEAQLIRSHGFSTRIVSSSAADIVLPGLGGGSLAFVLAHGDSGTSASLVERAAAASKAARRCTVLWVQTETPQLDSLQLAW